ncbi:AAA family ATPase [Nocardia sp. alder85J]|uniref:AAA family ATPase n=1 Tax=Nocardia sp. alder85J TaxID=2862949 RepID=UPI001CD7678E|nr:AAA family ATPase [Nocardia sp. alder85J]MCX4097066.1 AAA family ATPase [Nocardia sp. alder85J]
MYLVDGQRRDSLKLAISGTYSTGKTTTTEALSIVTGIPRTHALTARQLLLDVAPGKSLVELNSIELLQLGMRRFEERVRNESQLDSFISDGSVIHEWVYGVARMQLGINPGASLPLRVIKKIAGIGRKAAMQEYTDLFGEVCKDRAAKLYDVYVHLPVEFPLRADGHRPVSEPFRKLSDDTLLQVVKSLGLPYEIVGGTLEERLTKIVELFDLPTVMPVAEAVETARAKVGTATEAIEDDERVKAAQRQKSLRRRLAYTLRY